MASLEKGSVRFEREREMLLVLTVGRRRENPKGTTSCSPDHGKNTDTQIVNMTPLEWLCLWTLIIALELARRSTLVGCAQEHMTEFFLIRAY
jgi:hypothetical protein